MNITIDGLDTVKQLPWIGDRILKIDYDFEEGDLIAGATYFNPEEYEDSYIYLNEVFNNFDALHLSDLEETQLQQYILDQYH
jgi:hypothetical protein